MDGMDFVVFCVAMYAVVSSAMLVCAGVREQKAFLRFVYLMLGSIGLGILMTCFLFMVILGGH